AFVEFDFPLSIIPIENYPYNSRLLVEDTVRYQLNSTEEWHSMFPESGGFVRLGSQHRLFGVSMFHQLHCLDKLRQSVLAVPSTQWERWHTQHCLNYLRQMILCASSMRLEDVKNGEKVNGLGLEHECRDWSVLYNYAAKNFKDWPTDVYP
ncbi:hypothetical protein EV368DRAFT_15457, partial [Lentinula lateritia]